MNNNNVYFYECVYLHNNNMGFTFLIEKKNTVFFRLIDYPLE